MALEGHQRPTPTRACGSAWLLRPARAWPAGRVRVVGSEVIIVADTTTPPVARLRPAAVGLLRGRPAHHLHPGQPADHPRPTTPDHPQEPDGTPRPLSTAGTDRGRGRVPGPRGRCAGWLVEAPPSGPCGSARWLDAVQLSPLLGAERVDAASESLRLPAGSPRPTWPQSWTTRHWHQRAPTRHRRRDRHHPAPARTAGRFTTGRHPMSATEHEHEEAVTTTGPGTAPPLPADLSRCCAGMRVRSTWRTPPHQRSHTAGYQRWDPAGGPSAAR